MRPRIPRGQFNAADRTIWNRVFNAVPPEWRAAPPSLAMVDCLEFLVSAGAMSILDLGCGVGRWAVYLARAGLAVTASDFAEYGLRYGRRWVAEEGLGVRFVQATITALPFPSRSFDAVVAALVLDNVAREEMSAAIPLIWECVIDGGAVFCLFNPPVVSDGTPGPESTNPTSGVTGVVYGDRELRDAFSAFHVVEIRRYELGTRGLLLKKPPAAARGHERG